MTRTLRCEKQLTLFDSLQRGIYPHTFQNINWYSMFGLGTMTLGKTQGTIQLDFAYMDHLFSCRFYSLDVSLTFI